MNRTPKSIDNIHLEHFISTRTGEIIYISCECSLGRDHSYLEWRNTAGSYNMLSTDLFSKP